MLESAVRKHSSQEQIEIPGLGFVYSVTGIEDPNVDRAAKRVEEKLVSSNMTEEERNALRQQLMGLNKKKKSKKTKKAKF